MVNNYIKHAKREFMAAGWMNTEGGFGCGMQRLICKQVLELLALFTDHAHSGSTAPYAVDMFKKLAMFKPLTPLTGHDWEWRNTGCGKYQNLRASHVFKDGRGGLAYDINARIFKDADGSCWSGSGSSRFITFPHTPKIEYIDR